MMMVSVIKRGKVVSCLARKLTVADPLVLLTTNTKDFGGDKNSLDIVHNEITDDLDRTRARVCLNWDRAASMVLSRSRLKSI